MIFSDSTNRHQIVLEGTTTITSDQYKIGSNSMHIPGSLATPITVHSNNDDFNFGTTPFTIECWVRLSAQNTEYTLLFNNWITGSDGFQIYYHNSTSSWRVYLGNSISKLFSAPFPTLDTWTHVVVQGDGSTLRMYIDGVQLGSGQAYTTMATTSNSLIIGSDYSTADCMNGYMDEVRISRGIARYSSNFTPSTSPLTADSNTILLLDFETVADATFSPISHNASFQNGVNVTINGNSLTKINTDGWNGGASSTLKIVGDGGMQFTAPNLITAMVGLSYVDTTVSYTGNAYGINLSSDGHVRVYEDGTQINGIFCDYIAGDTFSVTRLSNVIYYAKNGSNFYTSVKTSLNNYIPLTQASLLVDVSLYFIGDIINTVQVWSTDDNFFPVLLSGQLFGDATSSAIDGGQYTFGGVYWYVNSGYPKYFSYDFLTPGKITSLYLCPEVDPNGSGIKDFILQASVDSAFTSPIDIYSSQVPNTTDTSYAFAQYSFTNATAYRYYRVKFLNTWRSDNGLVVVNVAFGGLFSDLPQSLSNGSELLHYKCNDNAANTIVLDSSSFGNDGTASETTSGLTVAGKINSAFFLDGDDYITVNSPAFNFKANSFSVALWFKTSSVTLENPFFAKRAWSVNPEDGYAAVLKYANSIRVHYYSDTDFSLPYSVTDDVWHHLIVLFDYQNHQVTLYLDNTLVATQNYTQAYQSNNYPLYIGTNQASTRWPGSLDDVRIFQGLLTEDNISFLYNSGAGTEAELTGEPLTEDFSENIELDEEWDIRTNPEEEDILESIFLTDNWILQTNPDTQDITDLLKLNDSWILQTNPDFKDINDILSFSDSWYIDTNPKIQDIFESIILNDSWSFGLIGTITTKFQTKLYTLLSQSKKFLTDLRTIFTTIKSYNTKLYTQLNNFSSYNTDLRVKYEAIDIVTVGSLDDFIVKLDGITLADVDYTSLTINLNLNTTPSNAQFVLSRRHDNLDYMLDGTYSQITNENKIQVYDGVKLLFTGYISEINADSTSDTIRVIAADCRLKMSKASMELKYGGTYFVDANHNGIPDEDTNEITDPDNSAYIAATNAPSYIRFEKNIYQAYNEVMSAVGSLVSGYDALPFPGSFVPEYNKSESDYVSLIDSLIRQTANCNWYIDENERLRFQMVGIGSNKTLNLASLNVKRHPYDIIEDSVQLNKSSSNYVQSFTVKRGKNIIENWRTQIFSGWLSGGFYALLKSLKEKTTFVFHQGIGTAVGVNFLATGVYYTGMNGIIQSYYNTLMGGWVSYPTVIVQWLDKNTSLDLPDITVGSGFPTKTLYLTSYGKKVSNTRYSEEQFTGNVLEQDKNGPWLVQTTEETFDQTAFLLDMANFELSQNNKKQTSANVSLLLDAYSYYNISYSDLINLSNTIQSGIYSNNNGFPLNIDSIQINCGTRTVSLGLTNYGKSRYAKTANYLLNYVPPKTVYLKQKFVWRFSTYEGVIYSTGE